VAGRILKEDVEALRHQADIVAIIGDYTSLRRAGKSFKGLCPFHTERTPSFTCTPDGNFFHCFGCGASGDIYDFLQRVEGLDFPEAVETLARRTGFALRYEQLTTREKRAIGERSRLVAVSHLARDHFVQRLLGDEGLVARDYLKSRGFGRTEADAFQLGFATESWDDLSRALVADGVDPADLIAIGVSVRNDRGGLRDRFRGRVIFPILDPGGDVIGFGGRILPTIDYGDFEPPKYLNSPETPLYRKSRVLYGVPQARSEIVARDQVLVCEGYTDVLALHQAGFANAVATCGTAVGVEHLRALSRYTKRVVLAFDADRAGVQAAERAWEAVRELAGTAAIDLAVLPLPEGRDPADLVRDVGAEGLRAAVAASQAVVPFLIAARLEQADLSSEQGRVAALREALDVLGRETDPELRRAWARSEIARPLGIAYDFVAASAARVGIMLDTVEGVASTRGRSSGGSRAHGGDARGGGAAAGGSAGSAAGGPGGGSAGAPATSVATDVRLERAVLRAVLQTPDLLPPAVGELDATSFHHPSAAGVWRAVTAAGGPGSSTSAILEAADDDLVRDVIRGLLLEEDPAAVAGEPELRRRAAWDLVHGLVSRALVVEEQALRARLAQADPSGDPQGMLALQGQLQDLAARRRSLRDGFED
jgi:DNA primase